MKLIATITSLFLATAIYAQTNLPPLWEIKTDSALTLPSEYYQFIEDPDKKLSFSDIQKPEFQNQFRKRNENEKGFGFNGVKVYWQRLRLKNLTGKDQKLVMRSTQFKAEYYIQHSDSSIEQHKTGWGIPYNQREGFKTQNAFIVHVADNEEILVYRRTQLFHDHYLNRLTMGYNFYESFVKENFYYESRFKADLRDSLVAGMLFFAFILNAFFYWIVREKVYFYYALFLLLEGVWYVTIGSDFLFRNHPPIPLYFDLVFTYSLFFFSVTQFVRHFLKTYIHYPRWDKIILVLLSLTIITIALPHIFYKFDYSFRGVLRLVNDIFFFFTMGGLLITFLLPRKEKSPFSTLSIIAAVPTLLTWTILYGIENFYNYYEVRFDRDQPKWAAWLDDNTPRIEMICIAWFAILFTWILLQQYARLRKQMIQQTLEREKERMQLMESQKEELEKQVESRTAELRQSITELKSTQQQLIQSEKMASLGELTAGIAHEIQNPLNFVNNFSDVNTELVDELKTEIKSGNIEHALRLADDVKQNSDKINFHGKRADSIVKSMLQHSRNSSGQKEPTDINALVDECLRLSYHGMRAKDKTFNAKTDTEFDNNAGKITIAPQDIGRVLLNLFTNAFYSLNQKKKNQKEGFHPVLLVKTEKNEKAVSITVRDNGLGVPQQVIDKIFQPFFTTKPVGEGTGLGLSMSYDIITKGHGGELKVNTKEGEFAEFIIILPDNPKFNK